MDIKRPVRTYELTYLVPGTYTDSELSQVKTEVDALLKKHKAEVIETQDWGRKSLAYVISHEMKKHRDAYFTHVVFSVASDAVPSIDHDVLLAPRVMRYMVVQRDEKEEKRAQAVAAKTAAGAKME